MSSTCDGTSGSSFAASLKNLSVDSKKVVSSGTSPERICRDALKLKELHTLLSRSDKKENLFSFEDATVK